MKGTINSFYRGMDIVCYPSRTENNKDTNKIESFWNIEAWKNGELKGSWEYSVFRIEPQNPNPLDRYYQITNPEEMIESGRDLVDKIIKEKK